MADAPAYAQSATEDAVRAPRSEADLRHLRDSVDSLGENLEKLRAQQARLEERLHKLEQAGTPSEDLEALRETIEAQNSFQDSLQREQNRLKSEQLRLESATGTETPEGGSDDPETLGTSEAREDEPEESVVPRSLEPTLFDVGGVLTTRGALVLEPSFEYAHTSVNRFNVRGPTFVGSILIGLVEAEQLDIDSLVTSLTARYGILNRLEVDARIPFVYRNQDVLTTLSSTGGQIRRELDVTGLGDIEFGARYQINKGQKDKPFFVAGLRTKSTTGTGPFEVDRDEDGLEEELPTGFGFWSLEPRVTWIYPTDPAVLFGNVAYLWNIKRDVGEEVGSTLVKEVDPGDAIRVGVGLGLALNEKVSFSLGATYDYIFKTKTKIRTTDEDGETESHTQISKPLQIGSIILGGSYRVSDWMAINLSGSFGVTDEATDFQTNLLIPIWFPIFSDGDGPIDALRRRFGRKEAKK